MGAVLVALGVGLWGIAAMIGYTFGRCLYWMDHSVLYGRAYWRQMAIVMAIATVGCAALGVVNIGKGMELLDLANVALPLEDQP